jgi:threonine synthase
MTGFYGGDPGEVRHGATVEDAHTGLELSRLTCAWCGADRAPDLHPWCRACAGSLSVRIEQPVRLPTEVQSLADFAPMLPVGREFISLGEGGTPLLPVARVRPSGDVFMKAEWMNPTGSFKDRGAAVAISAALGLGTPGIVCASTGNNGAAVSAYAARAGLPCLITVPAGTARGKVVQTLAHGAALVSIEGDFSDAYGLAERCREATGWANLTSTFVNPYMTSAHATIAYEIAMQLDGRIGSIIVPIGAGPMLVGIIDGLRQLERIRALTMWPVVVGVQAAGCSPIARAYSIGADRVDPWPGAPSSLAQSLNDPLRGYPADGTRTLRAVRTAGGGVVAVEDDEILRALEDLTTLEGVGCEPAGAAPLAALRRLDAVALLPRPVVLIVSGHLLKDPERHPLAGTDYIRVDPNVQPDLLVREALEAFRRRPANTA